MTASNEDEKHDHHIETPVAWFVLLNSVNSPIDTSFYIRDAIYLRFSQERIW